MKSTDILVVGGGLVGLGTAFQIQRSQPGTRVMVLEKENSCGRHQSTHNSGVLHCGLYYKPGSKKARLAVEGIREMTAFCRSENIPHEICGKLVVATNDVEVERLHNLHERGRQNGLEGLRWLESGPAKEIEPHARAQAALHVPQEGIVDYHAVVEALVHRIRSAGGELINSARVLRIQNVTGGNVVESTSGDFFSPLVVTCAGLHSDRISGGHHDARIVPFRGEYYKIRPERQHLVGNLIYPVPNPAFPFLGVHFTRLIGGGIEAGPNAVLAFKREGYRLSDISVRDLWDAATFPGLWRFLAKYPAMCTHEMWQSLNKAAFCRSLQKLVPDIQEADLEPGGSGVRAQAMLNDGSLVEDFLFVREASALHVLNAPSPAATASLAIGRAIVEELGFQPAKPLA